ncbi:metallophosphoesterase family protein [Aurantiacibacter spongiae]|uniref:Serine/threonine protein phosphatase n=1 Tax=Aurantiacibacter spongiae TaxID=2488860 RepID=A0A3N5CZ29_9SPHN|nr:metallophosphoesterase family protein [Aurantiacibacter spongiae]RPF71959.1 serine/threonine protein phosphatase [Aurantiacibacter spongiae]
MIRLFKNIFGDDVAARQSARVPDGERVYAVGDIHGRADLLETLIAAIEVDDGNRPRAQTTVILLGDLVDRGPESARVIALAREWQAQRDVRILLGNHEEMFLESFTSLDMLRHFLRHGGRDTVLSYGVDKREFTSASVSAIQQMMKDCVPVADRDFISGFSDMVRIGDYLFVHAGIEPGVPLEDQRRANLRWIREPFLSHTSSHGVVVVHGHTISDEPEDNGNRIGIDTGAYDTGRLTALLLEGEKRCYLEAVDDGGRLRTRYSPPDASPLAACAIA